MELTIATGRLDSAPLGAVCVGGAEAGVPRLTRGSVSYLGAHPTSCAREPIRLCLSALICTAASTSQPK